MSTHDWLERAKKEGFAIGAFNIGNLETLKAVAQAAAAKRSPVIVETSVGETEWMGVQNVVDLVKNYCEELNIPIMIDLDHAVKMEKCENAMEAGYDIIHLDGSNLSYEENVDLTKKVSDLSHSKKLIVEGELDHIGGTSGVNEGEIPYKLTEIPMTEPEKASEFVKATGIDIFAAFVGNFHGIYLKQEKKLDLERLKRISEMTGAFLSLHGSSGIPDDQIRAAITLGVTKINLNTEMRRVYKDTFEHLLKEQPEEYAIYKLQRPIVDVIQTLVEMKMDVFGSSGKA